VSYGDALKIVARNNPALTLPDGAARPQSSNETLERLAPEANSVQLHKLAKERQQERASATARHWTLRPASILS
jgi:hypothetical protein